MIGELDIEQHDQVAEYLRSTGRIGHDERPVLVNLKGGVSNRTVLVRRSTGEAWVLKQALPKLRVKVDWFSSPERIHTEALGLQWLQDLAPPGAVASLIFEDHSHHLLAMRAVPEPHVNWKTQLLAAGPRREDARQFGQLLGAIHAGAYRKRATLSKLFGDRSFFENLRLEPYYAYAAEQVPAAADFLKRLIEQTRAVALTLVHGDYSPKNILIHQNKLILLDHEVIHFGEPAFDVGFSMTHLLSKAHFLPPYRAAFLAAARTYWQTYRQALAAVPWANDLERRSVAHTLGCLLARVAGRSQLEYFEDHHRQRQQAAVAAMMKRPPGTMAKLITMFGEEIGQREQN